MQVKKSRSYVPKELCDMLVKKCTQCAIKRKTKESTDTMIEKPIATTRFMTMLKVKKKFDYKKKKKKI